MLGLESFTYVAICWDHKIALKFHTEKEKYLLIQSYPDLPHVTTALNCDCTRENQPRMHLAIFREILRTVQLKGNSMPACGWRPGQPLADQQNHPNLRGSLPTSPTMRDKIRQTPATKNL